MLKNINDLTLDNIGIWPRQIKVIVLSLCCAMLFALGYWFDTKNQLAQLQSKKLAEHALLRQIVIKYQLAANLPAYKKQLDDIQQSFKNMLQQLPRRSEVPSLLEDISTAGVTSGLEFKLFKPATEKQIEFYAELPIDIAVLGNYHQLGQFVSRISSLNRIVTLHGYTIEPLATAGRIKHGDVQISNEPLLMTITAKTYHYTEKQRPGL